MSVRKHRRLQVRPFCAGVEVDANADIAWFGPCERARAQLFDRTVDLAGERLCVGLVIEFDVSHAETSSAQLLGEVAHCRKGTKRFAGDGFWVRVTPLGPPS